MLRLENVGKNFGGLPALQDVSFGAPVGRRSSAGAGTRAASAPNCLAMLPHGWSRLARI